MNYNIAICEEEYSFRMDLIKMVNQIARKNKLQIKIRPFSDLESLKSCLKQSSQSPLDLIILDICFNGEEIGFDLAKKLSASESPINLIFISNSENFVFKGYTVDSKACLLKLVNEETLEKILLRIIKNSAGKKIVLQTPNNSLTLDLEQILYFEAIYDHLVIHYADSTTDIFKMTLPNLLKKLPQNQFFQTHRNFIVSLPAIVAIQDHEIVLLNMEHIPVSRKNYKGLQKKLLEWFLRQET